MPKRLLWHDREPWLYTYRQGGFEGYRALFTGRKLAPDLQFYARFWQRRWVRLTAQVVRPQDVLVLSTDRVLTVDDVERIKRLIPQDLLGRIVVAGDMTAHVRLDVRDKP